MFYVTLLYFTVIHTTIILILTNIMLWKKHCNLHPSENKQRIIIILTRLHIYIPQGLHAVITMISRPTVNKCAEFSQIRFYHTLRNFTYYSYIHTYNHTRIRVTAILFHKIFNVLFCVRENEGVLETFQSLHLPTLNMNLPFGEQRFLSTLRDISS